MKEVARIYLRSRLSPVLLVILRFHAEEQEMVAGVVAHGEPTGRAEIALHFVEIRKWIFCKTGLDSGKDRVIVDLRREK